ncbi:MAG TPA: DUF6491 family protein [Steroidobacteraceae bacterium]|nr:DUF6491 family protein [Steroidobacteraceae bacterium]
MKRYLASIVCITALLAGCASTIARLKGPDADLKYSDYAGKPITSFWMSSFDGWTPVEKDQLAVRTGINKVYLITVAPYCPDLRFAQGIGITSMGDYVDRFDKIIVEHIRCLIKQIQPVDMKKMEADRKALKDRPGVTPPASPAPQSNKT